MRTAVKNVTIPRDEYRYLRSVQDRFEILQKMLAGLIFFEPPTKNAKTILAELKSSKKYSPPFVRSIERGLKESTYFSR